MLLKCFCKLYSHISFSSFSWVYRPQYSEPDFAECKSVAEAFAALMGIFIEELRKADFGAIKICQAQADKELKNKINKVINIYKFFKLLTDNSLYFNWMNIEYLYTIASAAGNTKLQDVLKDYSEAILSKTLGEIWNSLPLSRETKTKYFEKVRAEFRGRDPDKVTLILKTCNIVCKENSNAHLADS